MKRLKNQEGHPLSDKEIFKLLNNDVKLVLYPELEKYNNIDEVFGNKDSIILLFESKPNYGHWCCLFKRGDGIEFFDPYSSYPDDSLNYINPSFAKKSNQDQPYLSRLLYFSPYKLYYNEHPYQKKDYSIKTCGRHCVMRLYCKRLNDSQYHSLIKQFCKKFNITPDELVTLVTR